MELTSLERGFLEQNIEEELSDYKKYMEQAQQATHPQLARLWQMFAQDERRHAERQRAVLELAAQAAALPPATVPAPPVAAVPAPSPGFEWRGAPWPGPSAGGVARPRPVVLPRPAAPPAPWPGVAPGYAPGPAPGRAPWPATYPKGGCCGGDPR